MLTRESPLQTVLLCNNRENVNHRINLSARGAFGWQDTFPCIHLTPPRAQCSPAAPWCHVTTFPCLEQPAYATHAKPLSDELRSSGAPRKPTHRDKNVKYMIGKWYSNVFVFFLEWYPYFLRTLHALFPLHPHICLVDEWFFMTFQTK